MIKLFNKWESTGINVEDPGLIRYINLEPVIIPTSCGRSASNQFWKSKYHIVERLANKLMGAGHKGKKHKITSGHTAGKGLTAYSIVEKTFTIIEQETKQNPIAVFVKALENAAPREEITTIEYGGARYPKAVECAPQRRVDLVLRLMTQGAYASSFGKKKKIERALAEEIIKAFNKDTTSNAMAKKLELERQADASR
tara:strand:- start:175 stop:768 length:594 start_codon:yes stop_codon:yes gene_type:complete